MSEHCDPPEKTQGTEASAKGSSETPWVLLVGRPNSGKSSLYNALTGGDAHVGNFPGVTVDVLEASAKLASGREVKLVDLPGLYTLASATDDETDEGVARRFLDEAARSGRPVVLVQVLDATMLELGLRLTAELRARGEPVVVAATQVDLLERDGLELDAGALEEALGCAVVAVSARRAPDAKKTVFSAVESLLARADSGASSRPYRSADGPHSAELDPAKIASIALRARASSSEGAKTGAPAARPTVGSASANVTALLRARSDRLDRWLLHPAVGPVLFLALMSALFAAVFLVADPVSSFIDGATRRAGARISGRLGEGLLSSFLSDGLLGGAGTVLAFLPQIVILTVAMELLEASGYLARGAFLVDRALRVVGLGGRAFVPYLSAHACAIPAIGATRILRDPRERLVTILTLPLMTCSARIPTYGLLIAAFFPGRSAFFRAAVFVGLYGAGVFFGLLAALIVRRTAVKGRGLPLLLELPAYRAPEAKVVARTAWKTAKRFVRDVGTTIVVASALLWCLLNVPSPLPSARAFPVAADAPAQVVRVQRSVAASVGRALEPVSRLAGFDWRVNVGLIGSFGARELMVGTMGVIFGLEDADEESTATLSSRMRDARDPSGAKSYSTASGLALMAFFVLACQCMSTAAAIRRETRTWRWPLFVLAYTYALGFACAVLVFQLARLFAR